MKRQQQLQQQQQQNFDKYLQMYQNDESEEGNDESIKYGDSFREYGELNEEGNQEGEDIDYDDQYDATGSIVNLRQSEYNSASKNFYMEKPNEDSANDSYALKSPENYQNQKIDNQLNKIIQDGEPIYNHEGHYGSDRKIKQPNFYDERTQEDELKNLIKAKNIQQNQAESMKVQGFEKNNVENNNNPDINSIKFQQRNSSNINSIGLHHDVQNLPQNVIKNPSYQGRKDTDNDLIKNNYSIPAENQKKSSIRNSRSNSISNTKNVETNQDTCAIIQKVDKNNEVKNKYPITDSSFDELISRNQMNIKISNNNTDKKEDIDNNQKIKSKTTEQIIESSTKKKSKKEPANAKFKSILANTKKILLEVKEAKNERQKFFSKAHLFYHILPSSPSLNNDFTKFTIPGDTYKFDNQNLTNLTNLTLNSTIPYTSTYSTSIGPRIEYKMADDYTAYEGYKDRNSINTPELLKPSIKISYEPIYEPLKSMMPSSHLQITDPIPISNTFSIPSTLYTPSTTKTYDNLPSSDVNKIPSYTPNPISFNNTLQNPLGINNTLGFQKIETSPSMYSTTGFESISNTYTNLIDNQSTVNITNKAYNTTDLNSNTSFLKYDSSKLNNHHHIYGEDAKKSAVAHNFSKAQDFSSNDYLKNNYTTYTNKGITGINSSDYLKNDYTTYNNQGISGINPSDYLKNDYTTYNNQGISGINPNDYLKNNYTTYNNQTIDGVSSSDYLKNNYTTYNNQTIPEITSNDYLKNNNYMTYNNQTIPGINTNDYLKNNYTTYTNPTMNGIDSNDYLKVNYTNYANPITNGNDSNDYLKANYTTTYTNPTITGIDSKDYLKNNYTTYTNPTITGLDSKDYLNNNYTTYTNPTITGLDSKDYLNNNYTTYTNPTIPRVDSKDYLNNNYTTYTNPIIPGYDSSDYLKNNYNSYTNPKINETKQENLSIPSSTNYKFPLTNLEIKLISQYSVTNLDYMDTKSYNSLYNYPLNQYNNFNSDQIKPTNTFDLLNLTTPQITNFKQNSKDFSNLFEVNSTLKAVNLSSNSLNDINEKNKKVKVDVKNTSLNEEPQNGYNKDILYTFNNNDDNYKNTNNNNNTKTQISNDIIGSNALTPLNDEIKNRESLKAKLMNQNDKKLMDAKSTDEAMDNNNNNKTVKIEIQTKDLSPSIKIQNDDIDAEIASPASQKVQNESPTSLRKQKPDNKLSNNIKSPKDIAKSSSNTPQIVSKNLNMISSSETNNQIKNKNPEKVNTENPKSLSFGEGKQNLLDNFVVQSQKQTNQKLTINQSEINSKLKNNGIFGKVITGSYTTPINKKTKFSNNSSVNSGYQDTAHFKNKKTASYDQGYKHKDLNDDDDDDDDDNDVDADVDVDVDVDDQSFSDYYEESNQYSEALQSGIQDNNSDSSYRINSPEERNIYNGSRSTNKENKQD